MALPSSGQIWMSQVNTELGRPATQYIDLNDSAVRNLAGVPSGTIWMSSLHGKSSVVQEGPAYDPINYPNMYVWTINMDEGGFIPVAYLFWPNNETNTWIIGWDSTSFAPGDGWTYYRGNLRSGSYGQVGSEYEIYRRR